MTDPITRLNEALKERYRIDRELGEGGMANVYLADDLRHDRKVALKVLKPELAAVVGAERFLAEIKTTANLQHPHILPLFDSGEADRFLFYVMPFVEGESLRDRLDREKQLPVDEAVAIAAAVGSALDYAHRHDVIHRDIKPANILLHDGQPVVADFGIALAVQEAGGGRLTETGLSLGTPYYMSPEQATADRDPSPASDVYSVGCVLYEMLTGELPFTGSTAQAVLGRILTADVVPPTEHRKSIPEHVEAVLLQALERLPADRFQTAAEFVDALKDPSKARRRPEGVAVGGPKRQSLLPWGLFAAALAALLYSVSMGPPTDASLAAPVIRAVLDLAPNQTIDAAHLAISRDGRRIAVGGTEDGVARILVRGLADAEFRAVPNTEGADLPFLSPDGNQVAFRGGGLKRVSLDGGPASVIDAEASWAGGDWTADGTLYYPTSYISGLWRKPADGGVPERLTEPESGELAHWHPQLMPDGHNILFTAFRTPIDSASIAVFDMNTGERKTVQQGAVFGRYVSTGHLLFARENTLFAVRMDPTTMQTNGQAVPVLEDVAMDHPDGVAGFAISENGTAVYIRASEYQAPADLVWVDREGNQSPVVPEAGVYGAPALSPDGRLIALTVTRPGEAADVWVLDPARGVRTPITVGGGADFQPLWTADGQRIIYVSESPVFDLFWRRFDGSGASEPLLQSRFDKYPFSVTPDGSTVIIETGTVPESSIEAVELGGASTVETVDVPAEGDLTSPRLSPDGSRLAFTSNQSGRTEVYVVSYPGMTNLQTVSLNGGVEPRWTKAGSELVFRHGNQILALAVDPDTGVLGTPEVLFEVPILGGSTNRTAYDVTPDGERFITVTRPSERSPRRVVVITNFFEELRRLVPEG